MTPGYSRRHYRLLAGGSNAPTAVAERQAQRRAAELARFDVAVRFPELTAANAAEAMRFQEERLAFHKAAILAAGR